MPKRVLLMISSMRGGGSERQVLMLAKHLSRERFEPHLYLTEAAGDLLREVPEDVAVHAFDREPREEGWYFPGRELRRQIRFLRRVVREQSIDVVYDRTFHMTLLAGDGAAGAPRVATIVSPPHLAVPLVEKRFVALKRMRLAKAYCTARHVVAVSRLAADSAESYYGLKPGSVNVIRNPVDAEAVQAAGIGGHRRSDRTTLVCVGRMTAEKGHADLLEALAKSTRDWPESRPPLLVRLVGDGPMRHELENSVQSHGLDDTVEFAGAISPAAPEIASADALVLPSRFEGLPNVVLEAMTLGVPVIATKAGGTIELQADEPTAFWAEPGDARSIAAAIGRFAREPETAVAQIAAAKKVMADSHDLRNAVGQIEDLLDGRSDRSV